MNHLLITDQYYASWLDIPEEKIRTNETFFVESKKRGVCQRGYPSPFSVYVLINHDRAIVSYHEKHQEEMEKLKDSLVQNATVKRWEATLEEIFNVKPNHNIKYVYVNTPSIDTGDVTALEKDDFSHFETFFMRMHPKAKELSWLKSYYEAMVDRKLCYGLFVDDQLVSVTEAPEMPYLQDRVQEIGINTLSQYQGKGYAKKVCQACIQQLLRQRMTPIWSTNAANIASDRLAHSLGFQPYADVFTISG